MAHICMVLKGNIHYDGRVRKEISTLVAAGHQIELIVLDVSKTASGGEDLGAKIHYIPVTIWSQASVNFLNQLLVFNRQAASLIKQIRPTHIHCHDLDTLFAGVWAKKEVHAKLVFDAHELFPEQWGGMREKVWSRIEKWCIKYCDHVIMPEQNRIAYLQTKYPFIPEPCLLQNFPCRSEMLAETPDLFRKIYPIRPQQHIVLHTGTLHPYWRHVEELIDSMALCGEDFVLILVGGASQYQDVLHHQIQRLGVEHSVFIHDSVPHAEILRYMASADIGTAFYRNINLNNYYCASNKLYEFIALEKPVLTNRYPGLLDTVERFRQGICLAEVTPQSLAEAYHRVSDTHLVTPGAHKYFWEDEAHRLLQLYQP